MIGHPVWRVQGGDVDRVDAAAPAGEDHPARTVESGGSASTRRRTASPPGAALDRLDGGQLAARAEQRLAERQVQLHRARRVA